VKGRWSRAGTAASRDYYATEYLSNETRQERWNARKNGIPLPTRFDIIAGRPIPETKVAATKSNEKDLRLVHRRRKEATELLGEEASQGARRRKRRSSRGS
jgi:hypothetical protein